MEHIVCTPLLNFSNTFLVCFCKCERTAKHFSQLEKVYIVVKCDLIFYLYWLISLVLVQPRYQSQQKLCHIHQRKFKIQVKQLQSLTNQANRGQNTKLRMFINLMTHSLAGNANLKRKRAPLFEQYVRNIEEQAFTDSTTGQRLTYTKFSSTVKHFGYSGLTQLNEKHLKAIMKHLFASDWPKKLRLIQQIFFSQDCSQQNLQVSVDHLLQVSALLCSHTSDIDQLNELWLLVNKLLDDTVPAQAIAELVNSMTEIAVNSAILLLSAHQPEPGYEQAQLKESLLYLNRAKDLVSDFCQNFASNLPTELDFEHFAQVIGTLCMNSSQLRMEITSTPESQTGRDVVISQVSTVILAYLPKYEKLLTGQHVCKKWYRRFVPLAQPTIPLNFCPWQGRTFRLRFESSKDQRYLANITGLQKDVREKCGRTNYASAGAGEEYKNFRWTIDSKGTLKAADNSNACLAAHRTYVSDCQGRDATYLISTVYPGHENLWRLERYGDLERQRYIVSLKNSKCVKDNVNMIGWMASAQVQEQHNQRHQERDNESCYVYVCDRKRVQLNEMPVWQLELDLQQ